jgi:hypothetical protein
MTELMPSLTPGEWFLFDGHMKIAVIREVRIGPKKERMIRSVTWAEKSEDRILIGYFPHIEMAAYVTWDVYREEKARAERRKDPSGNQPLVRSAPKGSR